MGIEGQDMSGSHSRRWIGDEESVRKGAGVGESADVGSKDVRRGMVGGIPAVLEM